ncbi:MAG TPA: SDR family oxidoreductase [Bacteroidetes bacterium]|nr:SDR family oxidoreductase [Bacteroidota bacterium]
MNLDLSGKNAIVCGSTQGIGRAAALELAGLGANLTLVARNAEKLKTAVATLPTAQGQKHGILVADFSRPGELQRALANHFAKEKEPIHILVNNTGGPPAGPAHKAGLEEFRTAFNQHLVCNQVLVQAVLEGMQKAGYGRIINVISTSVKQPLNNLGVSNTIRGAVANWAKTLANELGSFGITVNNVLPGATATGRLDAIIKHKAAKGEVSIDAAADAMKAIIPAKRFAKPAEIAYAIAFLASPAAAYINGINLPVDGGRTTCL